MSKHIGSAETNRQERVVDDTILSELEYYKGKVILLERDVQSLLDEKEELVIARDDLRLKKDHLNERLMSVMRNTPGTTAATATGDKGALSYDIDALYLENR